MSGFEQLKIQPATAEIVDSSDFSVIAQGLVEEEKNIPVIVGVDQSIRPKVLDTCGMSCTFCHNEGTPVAAAKVSLGIPNFRYKGGRVSVFEKMNGVDFLPGLMLPDREFEFAIGGIKAALGSSEMHLTGGEPTLHPTLPGLIEIAARLGYSVGMTSNGENGEKILPDCADKGLSKVNFSIFGTTAEELASVQNEKFRSEKLAQTKMVALDRSIRTALEVGLKVSANIVMSDPTHAERVQRVIKQYAGAGVSVRILNDLDNNPISNASIYELLARIGAVPQDLTVEAGSSNSRVRYLLPDGTEIYFKQIRRTTLPETCKECTINNDDDCKEGYYGVRLYVDQDKNYKVGVCLQRMDLTAPLQEFVSGGISKEIVEFRNNEYNALTDYYKERMDG